MSSADTNIMASRHLFSLVSLENYSVSLVKVNLKLWISSVVIQSKDVMYSGFRLSKNDALGQRFMPQVAELIMLCSLIAAIENFWYIFTALLVLCFS